jgi:hypothetical protein
VFINAFFKNNFFFPFFLSFISLLFTFMGLFKKSSKKPLNGEGIQYSMTPRHGHNQDVFDKDGVRQVAGCLPIDPINKRFLLVTSSSNPDTWVIVSCYSLTLFFFFFFADTVYT